MVADRIQTQKAPGRITPLYPIPDPDNFQTGDLAPMSEIDEINYCVGQIRVSKTREQFVNFLNKLMKNRLFLKSVEPFFPNLDFLFRIQRSLVNRTSIYEPQERVQQFYDFSKQFQYVVEVYLFFRHLNELEEQGNNVKIESNNDELFIRDGYLNFEISDTMYEALNFLFKFRAQEDKSKVTFEENGYIQKSTILVDNYMVAQLVYTSERPRKMSYHVRLKNLKSYYDPDYSYSPDDTFLPLSTDLRKFPSFIVPAKEQ